MTETLLALLPLWGAVLVGLANFLACMALPIPASLIMLAAGAFVASEDLSGPGVWMAALIGALAGDQAGYLIGRIGGPPVLARLARRRSGAVVARATDWLHMRRVPAIFFSRWLVSALGPYVNIAAGAARMGWAGFTLPGVVGEVIWVSLYIGLGFFFAADVQDLGDTLGNLGLALAGGVVAVTLGRFLWRAMRERGE
jgi:membrane-associated protein